VSLIFEEPHGVPKLFSDDRKVSHILRNYISNALKFTPSGEVRVSAVCEAPDTITFSVRDTGIGIPAASHGEVFRISCRSIRRCSGATGLWPGPGAVKRLAELLGGYVGFESEVGVGSRFYVTLPYPAATPVSGADHAG
jgi:signal transduction histidine kinase